MSRRLGRAAVIAAIYTALCVAPGLSALSFGPVQFRVAESLTLLPVLFPEAIGGLFVGAFLANLTGPIGLVDAVWGSLATLVAALLTYRLRHTRWAPWPPVLVNAFGVSLYLRLYYGLPYPLTALGIGIGQAAVVFTLGRLLVRKLRETNLG